MAEDRYSELVKELGEILAEGEVECLEHIYQEEAEYLAEEGVTLTTYMTGDYADENLYQHIDENVAQDIWEQAHESFERIVKEKYGK